MMASSDYQDWMTGTTIMAVEFDGGVVIGADSRTTIGADFANRVIVKLAPAQGSAAATQAIADRAKYHLNFLSIEMGGPPLVKTVANVFREIYYTNRDDLTAGIICAGWDKSEGGQVFSIPLGGMCVRQPFAIEGSGSTYIYGHCDATFKRNMTKEECLSFVSNAVALAMSYDSSPGGIIHLTVIDETGIEKRVIQGYHPTSEEMVEITNEEGNYVKCPGEVIFDTGNLLGTAISAKPVKHTVDQANKRCYTEEARDGFAWTISRLKIKIELKLDVRKFSLVALSKGIELLMRMDLIEQLSKGFILEKYTLGLLLLHNMSSS